MPKVSPYLSGKTAKDFEEFVKSQKERSSSAARVTEGGCAAYLIRKGLEAEKRRAAGKVK